ncbi:MAG: type 1 glutamine amidotransferase [Faecousia sp.]
MERKLLHLYDDVMNLYGEYANVSLLARFLTDLGHSVQIDTLSLYEKKDISGYDFYFMGAGTERRQKLALSQLVFYRDALKNAMDESKVMLFTGNSFEMLGAKITDADGREYDGLHLLDFETVETKRRITGDCLAKTELFDDLLVGFMNKCSITTKVEQPFCSVIMGFGNEEEKGAEGFRAGNCFGTHLTGPILVKNPAMLRCIADLLGANDSDRVSYPYMEKGYETTASELKKRLEQTK